MFGTWKKPLAAAAVTCAVLAAVSLSSPGQLFAQVRAALVQDIDEPARGAFQAQVNLSLSGVSGTGISIPAGKRLVIDYVTVAGSGPSSGTQPYVDFYTTIGGGASTSYQLILTQSPLAPQQFQNSGQVTIYGDTVFVSLAYAGNVPFFLNATVTISGHLVSIP